MDTDRLYILFNRYVEGFANPEEKQELMQGLADPIHAEALRKWIGECWEKKDLPEYLDSEQSQQLYNAIHEMINPKKRTIRLYPWSRIAVAAVIMIMIFSGAYFSFFKLPDQFTWIFREPQDIKAPVVNRATIVLADGRHLYLDSVNNGQLAVQGKAKLMKLANGEIAYQIQGKTTVQEMIYNTFSNPRGSKVATMKLADGTKVWLNAGSSLTYPVAFNDNERKLRISGEAYFEVAHANTPFKVCKKDMEVKVLGTHFNVNAYDDEESIKISLLEGSVLVSSSGDSSVLKPGQQAAMDLNGNIKVMEASIDEAIAWKKGYFQFNDADIETVMRQVARWYDVEVIYKNKPAKLFRGGMSRNVSVLNVFKILEETGAVKFKIEGKTVIII